MSATTQQAVVAALEYLMTVTRAGVRPPEAQARLRALQQQHPDTKMKLVWEEEVYDGSLHYDALLRLPEGATVSLSYCPERALPWPLRGVHRWSEAEMARVNDIVLRVEQVIACLDFIWAEAPLLNRLINVCLIQEELNSNPVELSDADLQQGLDSFRRAHKLYNAEATYHWMQQRGLTHEQLERLVADNLAIAKLRDRVAADLVERRFAAQPSAFDIARFGSIEFADEVSAHRVYQQIVAGELDFYTAAQDHFLTAQGEQAARPLFATLRRSEAATELEAAICNAAPGELVKPTPQATGYAIALLLSLTPARLDEATQALIKESIFNEWLAERRQAARIEWFWGNAERIAQAA